MDWGKAKNILLVLLFALNLMLGAAIVNREIGARADKELYSSVTRILDDRGVVIRCDYQKQITGSEFLLYGDGARFVENCAKAMISNGGQAALVEMPSRESLKYTDMKPADILNTSSLSHLDSAIRELLTQWGIDISAFTTDYSAVDDSGYYFQYILNFNGKMVFDSYFNVMVNESGGVSEIKVNYREIKPAADERLMKVIPAYQVILKNYYDRGTIIASINIGYMGQNTARENPYVELEEHAVWRVRLDNGSERFFDATYGDEINLYI